MLSKLRTRVVNDKCKRYQKQDKEEHVHYGITMLREINIELGSKNNKRQYKRQDRAWPNENKNT